MFLTNKYIYLYKPKTIRILFSFFELFNRRYLFAHVSVHIIINLSDLQCFCSTVLINAVVSREFLAIENTVCWYNLHFYFNQFSQCDFSLLTTKHACQIQWKQKSTGQSYEIISSFISSYLQVPLLGPLNRNGWGRNERTRRTVTLLDVHS